MKKYLTKEKLEEFRKELKKLKTIERPKIIERVKIAASFGDLSENSEYQNAKEEQGFLEGKILELEEIIKQAEIVTKKENTNYIRIGSFVVLENTSNQKREEFEIVGIGESNPMKGKISYESPLGVVLLKKQKGDVAEIAGSKKKTRYKIIEIR